jgi:hypothetical protein
VTKQYRAGDWVRFMRDGILVVGVVSYVRPGTYPGLGDHQLLYTDAGPVSNNGVLEARGAEEAVS